jgi:aryl-alcohol dehydrogenase-like predicted oxidoreductase
MEYTTLGETGLQVSPICLGTWRFGEVSSGVMETDRADAHELLDAFAERGGNFIDTANGYGEGRCEEWIGEWLAEQDRED